MLFLRHNTDDLQLFVRVTGNDTGTDSGCHAVQSTGVGDDNALHIFNDVAADEQPDFRGNSAQNLCCLGSGVSQSDRLSAAHGRTQLFVKNIQILLIQTVAFLHGDPSFDDILPYNIANFEDKINHAVVKLWISYYESLTDNRTRIVENYNFLFSSRLERKNC